MKAIKTTGTVDVQVGPRGDRNAKLANIHEFGAPKADVPARPHLRPAFDANKKRYQRIVTEGLKTAIDLKAFHIDALMTIVGGAYRSDVIKKIESGVKPKVARKTQERKTAKGQGTTSLIATGQYKNSIKAVTVKK